MGHRFRVAKVVGRDEVDIGAALARRAEEVAPDAPEAVDTHANAHPLLPVHVPAPGNSTRALTGGGESSGPEGKLRGRPPPPVEPHSGP